MKIDYGRKPIKLLMLSFEIPAVRSGMSFIVGEFAKRIYSMAVRYNYTYRFHNDYFGTYQGHKDFRQLRSG